MHTHTHVHTCTHTHVRTNWHFSAVLLCSPSEVWPVAPSCRHAEWAPGETLARAVQSHVCPGHGPAAPRERGWVRGRCPGSGAFWCEREALWNAWGKQRQCTRSGVPACRGEGGWFGREAAGVAEKWGRRQNIPEAAHRSRKRPFPRPLLGSAVRGFFSAFSHRGRRGGARTGPGAAPSGWHIPSVGAERSRHPRKGLTGAAARDPRPGADPAAECGHCSGQLRLLETLPAPSRTPQDTRGEGWAGPWASPDSVVAAVATPPRTHKRHA